MTHVLIVDEAESFGGSLVVAGMLVNGLNGSCFRSSVAIAFQDEFTERAFVSAANVFVRRSAFSYKRRMRWRARVAKVRNRFARQGCQLAISIVDVCASIRHCIELVLLILQERVSLVHSNNSVEALVAGLLTRRPIVYHLHGVSDWRRWLTSRCAVVAISKYVYDAAVQHGMNPKSMRIIPNGVPLPALDSFDRATARRWLGIPEDAPVVALPGRVMRWKGQAEFLRAAREVHRSRPNVHFVLVGGVSDGNPRFLNELMDDADRYGIGGHWHCTGYVAEVQEYLFAADVVVHASIEPEPFGLVIIEGMAMARPVIASSLGAGPEIITDEVDGLLVDPRDTAMLASKINRLLEDSTLAWRLGREARLTVERKYSSATMSDAFCDLYRELVEEHSC